MAVGVGWTLLGRIAERGISVISMVILASLLLPADFGLVAMATAILAGLELLGAFSFDVVLIQKQNAGRAQYDTAWTFNVGFGVASGLVLILIASPAAHFYEEPRLQYVMYGLALSRLIGAFANIGTVDFRKYLQFDKEFRFGVFRKLSGFLVTVPLAWALADYRALVAGIIASQATSVVLSYAMHPYRPTLTLSARKELFRFSAWLMINNLLGFLWNRSSDFIVGKLAGARVLGLYSISYEMSSLATTEITAAISRAVYPGYAKMAEDLAVLRQSYLNVLGITALAVIPLGAGLSALAPQFVHVVLGEQWVASVPAVRLLAISGAVSALQSNAGYVLLALGRPRIMTVLGAINVTVLLVLSIVLTVNLGLTGAALAVLMANVVVLPLTFRSILRVVGVGLHEFAGRLWRPIVASAVMALAVRALPFVQPVNGRISAAYDLALLVVVGAVIYGAVMLLLWRLSGRPEGAEHFVVKHAGAFIAKAGRLVAGMSRFR